MIALRRAADRGHANHGWLDTYHTFSFADYHDPRFMGFRSLRVINDDTVLGGAGFDTHPHRDMEIVTYVLSGALLHRDSLGHEEVLRAEEVQHITAGTGIRHSEYNHSPVDPVHFLQIWIEPERAGLKPGYEQLSTRQLSAGSGDRPEPWRLIASGDGRSGSLRIRQDADIHLLRLGPGEASGFRLRPGRHAWLHVAEGALRLNGRPMGAGDGAAVSEEEGLDLAADKSTRALLFDLA